MQAIEEGLVQTFIKAGAVVSTPTCGPCLGGYMGILQKARDVYQQLTETSLDVWDTLIQKYILQALLLQQQVQLQAR